MYSLLYEKSHRNVAKEWILMFSIPLILIIYLYNLSTP